MSFVDFVFMLPFFLTAACCVFFICFDMYLIRKRGWKNYKGSIAPTNFSAAIIAMYFAMYGAFNVVLVVLFAAIFANFLHIYRSGKF